MCPWSHHRSTRLPSGCCRHPQPKENQVVYVKRNSRTFGKLPKAGATVPLWGSLPAGRLGWQRLLTPRMACMATWSPALRQRKPLVGPEGPARPRSPRFAQEFSPESSESTHLPLFNPVQPLPGSTMPTMNISQLNYTSQTALSLSPGGTSTFACFSPRLSGSHLSTRPQSFLLQFPSCSTPPWTLRHSRATSGR